MMVKCKDCGYLAMKDAVSKALVEAEPHMRKTGEYLTSHAHPRQAQFFCYQGCRQLTEDQLGAASRMVAAINDDIACDRFIQHRHGRNAKEHEEMEVLEQLKLRDATREATVADEKRRADEERLNKDADDRGWRQSVENGVNRRFWTQILIQGVLWLGTTTLAAIGLWVANSKADREVVSPHPIPNNNVPTEAAPLAPGPKPLDESRH